MRIEKIDSYRDGGTIIIQTDEGDYCIDDRIRSKTVGKIFIGYPEDDNSNLDNFQDEMKSIILNSLEEFKSYNNESWNKYNTRINELFNTKE